jgi:hypothetical protein
MGSIGGWKKVLTVMVINSTNIYKTKKSTISHIQLIGKTMTYALEIQILAWDRNKNVAGLNRLIGYQDSPNVKNYN